MPAPPEKTLEGLFSAMALNRFEIDSWFFARATHIVDPHNFYVVPSSCFDYLLTLNKSRGQCSLEELKVNQTVIYRSQTLNRNVRGLIVDINEDKSQIYALDHGFMEGNVCVERIFHPLHEETTTTPSLARHCELYLCFPRGDNFSDEAIDAFKYYIGDERLKIFIQGKLDGKLRVTVYNSCPDDIATLLTTTGFTCFANFRKYTKKVLELENRPVATYQHPNVQVGQSFEVRIQSGEKVSSFYVMQTSLYKNYMETRRELDSYCACHQMSPENFVVGAPVGVKVHSQLKCERAIIMEIIEPNTLALVKLVDWGYDVEVPISKMAYVTAKVFTDTPIYSLHCCAAPLFKDSDELPPQWDEGQIFRVTVERIGSGFEKPHIVSISNV